MSTMKRGRPTPTLVLSDEQREILLSWTRRRNSAQALAFRARIVLACAAGESNTAVAEQMRCSLPTVGKWRARFVQTGVDGLLDEPRPGAPRKVTDQQVESVIVKTLETQPSGATHWSTRSLARASGLSQTAISRIWRAFALQPHRSEPFKLSRDPLAPFPVRALWKPPFKNFSISTINNPNRLYGRKLPTRSSRTLPTFVNELRIQDTSSLLSI